MIWQKILDLIHWSTSVEKEPASKNHERSAPPPKINLPRTEDDDNEATRPIYRIGKRKPSDFQKAIDLSG